MRLQLARKAVLRPKSPAGDAFIATPPFATDLRDVDNSPPARRICQCSTDPEGEAGGRSAGHRPGQYRPTRPRLAGDIQRCRWTGRLAAEYVAASSHLMIHSDADGCYVDLQAARRCATATAACATNCRRRLGSRPGVAVLRVDRAKKSAAATSGGSTTTDPVKRIWRACSRP